MNGNPHDRIEQIDAMRMGVDYHFQIKVRGFNLTVRPLSIQETIQVASNVMERYKATPVTGQNSLTEHIYLAQETLKLASTTMGKGNDPKITDYVMKEMTPDEIQYIFKQYVSGCDKVNPALELMKISEVEALVEDIKKNSTGASVELGLQLIERSFSELVSITHFLLTKGD